MYFEDGSVFVEKQDQCMTCSNFVRGVACPLLQALGMGVVTLDGVMYVTNCGFYKEHVRHLRLIHSDEQKADDDKNKED